VRPSSLSVIGLGAIGGSLAWQARLAGISRVVGYSRERSEGVQALQASAITEMADTPARAVRGSDLIVLALPPRPTVDFIGTLGPKLEANALLTDVCSVKQSVVSRAVAAGLGGRFAGGHPLAGTHDSGFAAARPDRLRGCVVYVCETGVPGGHRAAAAVMSFWEDVLGASPILIDAAEHDRQLAWTSHLPQAVASALAKTLGERALAGLSFGPGARDTTRLAASSPDMWLDIMLENRDELANALAQTEASLSQLRRLLLQRDGDGLLRYLTRAQQFRRGLDR
jgi:prephenate dehydrogenase